MGQDQVLGNGLEGCWAWGCAAPRRCQEVLSQLGSTCARLVSAAESVAINGDLFWWHQQLRQEPGFGGRQVICQSQGEAEPQLAPALGLPQHHRCRNGKSTVAFVGSSSCQPVLSSRLV